MATKILTASILTNIRSLPACRTLSSGKVVFNTPKSTSTRQSSPSKASPPPASSASGGDVPGLSKNVVDYGTEPVGPGAAKSTNYKNPEYFCYNEMSYFEAEIEMAKYRCPQPVARK